MIKSLPRAGLCLTFEAKLENWADGMDYCAVAVPAKITQALGTFGPVLVSAQLNQSEPFQVSLFPGGGGHHFIRIKLKVRTATKTKVGDRVRLQITVLDRADVNYPQDLLKALRAKGVMKDFKSLTPGRQHFILRRIEEAVLTQTREKRIQAAVAAAQVAREKRAHSSRRLQSASKGVKKTKKKV